jgi:hypothetical protein
MAWDFATEPKFQEELDWVEDFCNEKVEPPDYVFPKAAPAMVARIAPVTQVEETATVNGSVYRSPLIPTIDITSRVCAMEHAMSSNRVRCIELSSD